MARISQPWIWLPWRPAIRCWVLRLARRRERGEAMKNVTKSILLPLATLCLGSHLLAQSEPQPLPQPTDAPLAVPLTLPPGNIEVLQIDSKGSYMGDAPRIVDCPNNADNPFG